MADLVAARLAGVSRRTLAGVGFAFAAAISYGVSQVITREMVSGTPPLVGAMIALFWGTLGFALLSARNISRDAGAGDRRRGVLCFVGAGLFSASGVMLMFQALQRGEVVAISPVLATNPLFTLIFAALVLRSVERITPRMGLGAVLVVAGVVVLTSA